MLKSRIVAVVAILCCSCAARAADPELVLVEAESFQQHGGWLLDTQFVHIMGSPYLIAHGLGQPVKDATTTAKFPSTGTYKVFVRTKDWVAHWNAQGQPGKFQLLIDGKPLAETFGTKGAEWFWQDGGTVEITKPEVSIALHDLMGFDGRCDAILFSKDSAIVPPNDVKEMTPWRKRVLHLPEKPVEAGEFDLVVVGGGYGGLGSAISGARMGCKVALIQDRPVLGGNGSSEIRVWSQGGTTMGKYPKLGEIVEEFADSAKNSPGTREEFGDEKKETIVRAEQNINLFLNSQAYAVEMDGKKIKAVISRDMRTGEERRFTGKLFADCTGHGTIGYLAGAEYEMADGSAPDKAHMGMSNMWKWSETDQPQTFPETPWALPLKMADFPYPKNGKAEWFWEGGFFRNPITDLEYIRDWNLRAAYGAFNAMKNGDGKAKHANAKLDWIAYIGGNRESRLLKGDLTLTREDIIGKVDYDDGCVPTTWSIDLHVPKEQYAAKFPEDPFISKAIFDARVDKKNGYPVPYRCFYSKDIENLFMAGRQISVQRGALGTTRVMRTIGMMGEVVGKAASICVKEHCTPREVYSSHLEDLKKLMDLPGRARRATVSDPIDPNAPLPAEGSNQRATPRRPNTGEAAAATGMDPSKLAGLVIDDDKATLTGQWTGGQGIKGFVGKQYLYDTGGKGECTAKYDFTVPAEGKYDVRMTYAAHANRATNVPVTVTSADGAKTIVVNQKETAKGENGFLNLGTYTFHPDRPGSVFITNKGIDGHVSIDAVQVEPAK